MSHSWYEPAICQLLLASSVIPDDELKIALQKIAAADFPDSLAYLQSTPLMQTFSNINQRLRLMHMEIKTVIHKIDGVSTRYHGIANTNVSC
jgi:hypothetical protein